MAKHKHVRPQVSDHDIEMGVRRLQEELHRRLDEKGRGALVSSHEIEGVIREEFCEYKETVGQSVKTTLGIETPVDDESVSELYDIAVAALFGAICLGNGYCDW
jgi:hypothetical protein